MVYGPYAAVDYITSFFVDSRVDSNTFTLGQRYARVGLNPKPESTFSLSQGLRVRPVWSRIAAINLPPDKN
jgi:hypothetical protein